MNKTYLGTGVALGICFGTVLGAIMHDMGKGIALGLSFGLVMGAILGRKRSQDSHEK